MKTLHELALVTKQLLEFKVDADGNPLEFPQRGGNFHVYHTKHEGRGRSWAIHQGSFKTIKEAHDYAIEEAEDSGHHDYTEHTWHITDGQHTKGEFERLPDGDRVKHLKSYVTGDAGDFNDGEWDDWEDKKRKFETTDQHFVNRTKPYVVHEEHHPDDSFGGQMHDDFRIKP